MWLLEGEALAKMMAIEASGFSPTDEQLSKFAAFSEQDAGQGGSSSRIMNTANGVATISVHGLLTKKPSFAAMLFGAGNTTYSEIIGAINSAEADGNVERITIDADSPGGEFGGMFDVLPVVRNAKKPVDVLVTGLCASAMYAIASQAQGGIRASNVAAMIGSIGVIANVPVDDDVVTVASTLAPKKAPDATTDAGKEIIRETADSLHDIFVEAIAGGRNTTAENINNNFGNGATLLAQQALDSGMIDGIEGSQLNAATGGGDGNLKASNEGKTIMDLNELKANHPDIYDAAVQVGTIAERDRVSQHLILADSSGAMDLALAAIKDGSELTATLQTQHMAAMMNKASITARQGENTTAGDGAPGAPSAESEQTRDAKASADMMSGLAAQFGIELGAK